MLRIVQSTNAASAARYYADGLKKGEDYYSLGQETAGKWHGLALEKLGLSAGTSETEDQFTSLLHNRHPITSKQLTPRMNKGAGRIPGWDVVISAPKGLSILMALSKDEALLKIFRESVEETMAAMEEYATTRVRKGGEQSDRKTSNFVYCSFLHTTTRPLKDGIPDPHFHIHNYIHNVTFDEVEGKFKALKMRSIKDNAYFFEALFDSIATGKLEKNGYPVERTAKSWDIAHLPEAALRTLSRRTEEIERLAMEKGITDPKEKDKLGAKTRNKKDKGLKEEDLVKEWKSRLTGEELGAFRRVLQRRNPPQLSKVLPGQALDYAESKWFQNNSVVDKNRILAAALKFGVGSVSLADVELEMKRRGFIEREFEGRLKVTTPALVLEEARLIHRVRSGLGAMPSLHQGRIRFLKDSLSKEQRAAVRHLLKSHDRVLALRGHAGTGKTTLLTEFRTQLENLGVRLVALAPSADASRGVLREEGFYDANTIARFLIDPELQQKARGHVLLIDEAGLVGNREMERILDIVGPSTRVVLSGDVGQNPPVSRGNFLALLERFSGLEVFTVRQIYRQQEEAYRKAVEAMAERKLEAVFSRLEAIEALFEIPDDQERYHRAAIEYSQCLAETGVAPLVVSPTHAEARLAVSAIRERLKEIGHLGEEQKFLQYRDLKWEEAEKQRPENYSQTGLMTQFHQNAPGITRGSILRILGVDADKIVWVESAAKQKIALDLSKAERFRVFAIGELDLAPGDRIKITNGGKDLNGRRLENGKLSTIQSIGKGGRINLANGLELKPDFGHLAHGYDTSYSSQGKKANEVFVFQSSRSSKAASLEQFYVSISRGIERLKIFTDDRVKLQEAVGHSARRPSALEFTGLGDVLFMKDKFNGGEWSKKLGESRGWRLEKMESFVRKLAAERKLEPPKEKISSYVQYLEMEKAKRGSDGKSRSKGRPDFGKEGRHKQKGMVRDPRGNQKSSRETDLDAGSTAKSKAAQKPEHKKQETPKRSGAESTLFKQVGKAVDASSKHLREVVGRTRRGAEALKEAAKRTINFGNLRTTLGNLQNNPKSKDARIKGEAMQKPSAPKPTPTPPVIRRGK